MIQQLLWKLMSRPRLVRLGTSSPGLYKKAIEDFENAPPVPGAAVFIGSSSIRFWDTLARDMAPFPVVNQGFGGAHASHVLMFWKRMVPRHQPRMILFYAGDNDLAVGKSVDEVERDIRTWVEEVRAALPAVPVVLFLVKHSPQRVNINAGIDALNARIQTLTRPGVEVVDVDTVLQSGDGKPRHELFRYDGLHLSPAGYERWTTRVKPVVEKHMAP